MVINLSLPDRQVPAANESRGDAEISDPRIRKLRKGSGKRLCCTVKPGFRGVLFAMMITKPGKFVITGQTTPPMNLLDRPVSVTTVSVLYTRTLQNGMAMA